MCTTSLEDLRGTKLKPDEWYSQLGYKFREFRGPPKQCDDPPEEYSKFKIKQEVNISIKT